MNGKAHIHFKDGTKLEEVAEAIIPFMEENPKYNNK